MIKGIYRHSISREGLLYLFPDIDDNGRLQKAVKGYRLLDKIILILASYF